MFRIPIFIVLSYLYFSVSNKLFLTKQNFNLIDSVQAKLFDIRVSLSKPIAQLIVKRECSSLFG